MQLRNQGKYEQPEAYQDKEQAAENLQDLLTEKEARRELPMSLAWYRRRRWLKDGPPYIRVGNRVFYRRGSLREWIREQESNA